jgi:hypothetical protein
MIQMLLLLQMTEPEIIRPSGLTFWERFFMGLEGLFRLLLYPCLELCLAFLAFCAGLYLLSLAKINFQKVKEAQNRERIRKEGE